MPLIKTVLVKSEGDFLLVIPSAYESGTIGTCKHCVFMENMMGIFYEVTVEVAI